MRKYKEVTKPVTSNVLVELSCDLCGAIAKGEDWCSSRWEINDVEVNMEVRHKEGSSYPEGGTGDETKIDICPQCFTSKLIPFLEGEGAFIESKEWYW